MKTIKTDNGFITAEMLKQALKECEEKPIDVTHCKTLDGICDMFYNCQTDPECPFNLPERCMIANITSGNVEQIKSKIKELIRELTKPEQLEKEENND